MTLSDRMAAVKPYALGTAIGAVGAIVIGFSADLMVTTTNLEKQVSQARVDAFAQVCERQAAQHWTGQGKQLADLDGWRNDDREALAKRFAAGLGGGSGLDSEIRERCETLLEPA